MTNVALLLLFCCLVGLVSMCFPFLLIFVLSLSEGVSGWPQTHGSLRAYLWCWNYNVCVIVLVKVSVAVKGHHEHGNSYKGKHLMGWLTQLQGFSPLS